MYTQQININSIPQFVIFTDKKKKTQTDRTENYPFSQQNKHNPNKKQFIRNQPRY